MSHNIQGNYVNENNIERFTNNATSYKGYYYNERITTGNGLCSQGIGGEVGSDFTLEECMNVPVSKKTYEDKKKNVKLNSEQVKKLVYKENKEFEICSVDKLKISKFSKLFKNKMDRLEKEIIDTKELKNISEEVPDDTIKEFEEIKKIERNQYNQMDTRDLKDKFEKIDSTINMLSEPNTLFEEKPFSTEDLWIYGKNKKRTIIETLFSKEECVKIINEGEAYAKKHTWSKTRHSEYPTTDNLVTYKWSIWNMIKNKTTKMMYPKFAKMYKLNQNKLVINEVFLVKYSYDDGQRKLEYHRDWADFSFIVALNDQFEGGGTTFKYDQKNIQLSIGDCLLFSGRNEHKGNEITSGTRYILAGFLNYGLPEPTTLFSEK